MVLQILNETDINSGTYDLVATERPCLAEGFSLCFILEQLFFVKMRDLKKYGRERNKME
jgi:hypothetical protein